VARKKKGRARQGSGAITDWTRNGKKVGRKGFVDLPRVAGEKRQRKAFYGRSDEEVIAKMDEFRAQLRADIDVDASKQTVAQYLTQWLENVAALNLRAITLDSYERKIRCHIIPSIGGIPLKDLRPMHLSRLYSDVKNGKASRSVPHVHRVIHKALNDAVRHKLLPYNPASLVEVKHEEPAEMSVIPPDKLPAIVEALRSDWLYPLLYLALSTGARRGELCSLRWEDVDWAGSALRLRRSTQELPGGVRTTIKKLINLKVRGVVLGRTKTAMGKRVVRVSAEDLDLLRYQQHVQMKARQQAGSAWVETGLVFTTKKGMALRPSTVTNHWGLIRERVGAPGVRFHDLRHTHITALFKAGVHPKVVTERAGHSTSWFTMDRYGHVIPSMQEEAVQKFSGLMPKAVVEP